MTPHDQTLDALQQVKDLIKHQYSSTREGMSALQNACDACEQALRLHGEHDQTQMLREALQEIKVAAEDCAKGDYSWPHKQNYSDFSEHAKQALAAQTAPERAPTVEPSEDATRTLANPPERIYLQIGDVDAEFPGEIHWRDVTWCADQIERNDLVYVRSDLAERAPLVRLTQEEVHQLIKEQHGKSVEGSNILPFTYADAIMDAMQERNK